MGRLTDALDQEAINDRLAREHPADDYYENSAFPIRFIEQRRLQIIREFVGAATGLAVLEVGSGSGRVLGMFPGARLTAADISSVYLDEAKRNLEGYDVRFLHGEVAELELEDASFDRVICTEVLEHTVDPESILSELARVLRPDGIAVITVPNDPLILRLKSVAQRPPLRWLARGKTDWGGDDYHLHRWTPAEAEAMVARHFTVVERRFAPFRAAPIRPCFKCVGAGAAL